MFVHSVRQDESTIDNTSLGRWERLLNDADNARVWRAINWKGDFSMDDCQDSSCPSDKDFKTHFETVLNPNNETDINGNNETTDVTIPILDEPITPAEIHEQSRKMKPDTASGPDGVSPGVFSLLPVQWLCSLATLFNSIFLPGIYPHSWIRAKVFTVFKKGDRKDPSNYRGISVINTLAKLYDMVLCRRLSLWFKPYREQAGSQKQRSCIEHIVTLRILSDTARRKKVELFI